MRDERHEGKVSGNAEGTDKGSTKGRKARKSGRQKSWKEESARPERKRRTSSCESGRDEVITAARKAEMPEWRKGRQGSESGTGNAKFKRRMRKRSEDGSLKERKAGRKKRQLEGKSQLEEKE